MIVVITNLTDGPKKRPREVRVFNKRLLPGKSLRIPAQYVDAKMRALETTGHISIGPVPAWYADHKSKRVLTPAEVAAVHKRVADVAAAKARGKQFLVPASEAPKTKPAAMDLSLTDSIEEPDDDVTSETKFGKRSKRR